MELTNEGPEPIWDMPREIIEDAVDKGYLKP